MKSLDPISPASEDKRALEGQLRELYGRVVYTHKTHEKCADILFARVAQIRFFQILFSALTTVGFITAIFESYKVIVVLGAVFSAALLVLNFYKDQDLGSLAQKHKQTATDIWLIREKYLSLIVDLMMERKSVPDVLTLRDCLSEELQAIYAGAPSTMSKAYRMAQDALKNRGDMTFSDSEIDAFLPGELKRGTKSEIR